MVTHYIWNTKRLKKILKLRKPVKFRLLILQEMAAGFALYLRASLLDLSPEGNLPLLTAGRIKLQKAFCFNTKTEAQMIRY